ncbi:GRIM-19 [Pavlovales sp. CCMP2436]|nr:GRIM-19 [Pavlovales sp. CCMP2436]|mmetsp:Transcript_30753/g.76938  ORF Transcript_30753/g.76938 Transcript_30753/m.76938 type:complete len:143 (-) Transcript_30753:369-797(-)
MLVALARAPARRLIARSLSTKALVQDGPPVGGYAEIKYKKNIPPKGPSNGALLLGFGVFTAYGWYFLVDSIQMRNRVKIEQYDSRMSLLPYLQAEEDHRYMEVRAILDEKEAQLMVDVPGWVVNKDNFNTVDWVRPKAMPYL